MSAPGNPRCPLRVVKSLSLSRNDPSLTASAGIYFASVRITVIGHSCSVLRRVVSLSPDHSGEGNLPSSPYRKSPITLEIAFNSFLRLKRKRDRRYGYFRISAQSKDVPQFIL